MAEMAALGAVFGVPSTTLPGSAPGRFKALGPSSRDFESSSFNLGDTSPQAKFAVNASPSQRRLTTQVPGKRHSKLVDKWRRMLLCAASRSEYERTAY
jgi:hypothetical protein